MFMKRIFGEGLKKGMVRGAAPTCPHPGPPPEYQGRGKMQVVGWLCAIVAILFCAPVSWGDDFSDHIDLSSLRTLSVQHDQTMKTLDTFARQVVQRITGHERLDGHDAVYTLLDMSFHSDKYVGRNIIKIVNLPLRGEFRLLTSIDDAEKNRIEHEGTVSLAFLEQPDVQNLIRDVQANSVAKSKAIDQVMMAMGAMQEICQMDRGFLPAAIVPPAPSATDGIWHRPNEMIGNVPALVEVLKEHGGDAPAGLAGYEDSGASLSKMFVALGGLAQAWDSQDAALFNKVAPTLETAVQSINPAVYPSHAKRVTEVVYNRLTMMTIPGAIFYFFAFVLLLMAAQSGLDVLRLWGLRMMVVGLLIHTVGIGIRWWLVGGIFPPIKNEFESVMFSAWFGAVVGLGLELRSSRGIFGAAASFIGMLSLVAIFSAPYVTGTQIGGEIGQVQGILMSYWLYIHVTMVTASYSLIGMGFLLSTWWLVRYYLDYGTLRRVPGNLLSGDATRTAFVQREDGGDVMPAGGGAMALNVSQTIAGLFFLPYASKRTADANAIAAQSARIGHSAAASPKSFLATLDVCNLVVLQLAFWMLGAGVIFGAIWADQSWGRPWGWDPKETFALVTWIVYLIAVHVRVVTIDKAYWTAVLGFVGFFVMLFNWIGVNFLLVGLHSYA
jgi:cytochrome c-type biogenesis protein CcsB